MPSKGEVLRQLHADPELLVLINAWDAITAKVVADLPGCQAIATASHSIAASAGYPDGEVIPREEMIAAVGRIAAAVEVPVSADLEAGYGDVAGTIQQAISVGIVGANLEDQAKPFPDAVAAVAAAVAAADAEGVPFALNARTDVVLKARDRPREEVLADALARGRAFLEEGATCVFVPGKLAPEELAHLAAGLGERTLSVIAGPGALPLAELQRLGVARVSLGPWSQRLALTALADTGAAMLAGGAFPDGVRLLN
ncbi:MAG TPA: isocitrate lyase/phosphoenolpyruvate mutase family protein [Mycobacteriales bacterium]|nr:isocitrate lyase/phosphoenolpyruvate mutase family protein [Mycobacteriales bacterium]